MKRYLADNDSDINEYESVTSRKVRHYNDKYTAMIKKDELVKNRALIAREKREKLDRILGKSRYSSNRRTNEGDFSELNSIQHSTYQKQLMG